MSEKKWQQILIEEKIQLDNTRCQQFSDISQARPACFTFLPGYTILTISGNDAETFLQGQACCDIRAIKPNQSGLGAFCDVKGRAMATFRILRQDDRFVLLFPSTLSENLIKRLKMYVLRSDVSISDVTDHWNCFSVWGENILTVVENLKCFDSANKTEPVSSFFSFNRETPMESALLFAKNEDCETLLHQLSEFSVRLADSGSWQLVEILSGIPQISPPLEGEFVPQMLNLDLLDGIGFNKGCYIGQEIIARMHYLGKPKRRTYLAHIQDCNSAIETGTEIFDLNIQTSEKITKCGQILRSIYCEESRSCYSLVVLQIEHANSSQLAVGNNNKQMLEILKLPYKVD